MDDEIDNVRETLIKTAEYITSCNMPEDQDFRFLKNDLDLLLKQFREHHLSPCIPDDSNILLFWKDNKKKLPTLARLASST